MAGKLGDDGSHEGFYLDKDGVKQDANIHDPLLTPAADAASQAISRARMLDLGYTEQQVEILYGKQNS